MPVDRDGHCRPLASTERLHNLWRNFQAPHGLRRLDVGSKLHNLLLPTLGSSPCSCAAPPGSERCGVPREPVRVCEGPGIAANHEPVRSGTVGRDAGVLGEGTAPVERQLYGTRRSGELDVLAAKARRHGEAAVTVDRLLATPR